MSDTTSCPHYVVQTQKLPPSVRDGQLVEAPAPYDVPYCTHDDAPVSAAEAFTGRRPCSLGCFGRLDLCPIATRAVSALSIN